MGGRWAAWAARSSCETATARPSGACPYLVRPVGPHAGGSLADAAAMTVCAARTCASALRYISVMAHPTTAGVLASFARSATCWSPSPCLVSLPPAGRATEGPREAARTSAFRVERPLREYRRHRSPTERVYGASRRLFDMATEASPLRWERMSRLRNLRLLGGRLSAKSSGSRHSIASRRSQETRRFGAPSGRSPRRAADVLDYAAGARRLR